MSRKRLRYKVLETEQNVIRIPLATYAASCFFDDCSPQVTGGSCVWWGTDFPRDCGGGQKSRFWGSTAKNPRGKRSHKSTHKSLYQLCLAARFLEVARKGHGTWLASVRYVVGKRSQVHRLLPLQHSGLCQIRSDLQRSFSRYRGNRWSKGEI